jgi:hypothetical protein
MLRVALLIELQFNYSGTGVLAVLVHLLVIGFFSYSTCLAGLGSPPSSGGCGGSGGSAIVGGIALGGGCGGCGGRAAWTPVLVCRAG